MARLGIIGVLINTGATSTININRLTVKKWRMKMKKSAKKNTTEKNKSPRGLAYTKRMIEKNRFDFDKILNLCNSNPLQARTVKVNDHQLIDLSIATPKGRPFLALVWLLKMKRQ